MRSVRLERDARCGHLLRGELTRRLRRRGRRVDRLDRHLLDANLERLERFRRRGASIRSEPFEREERGRVGHECDHKRVSEEGRLAHAAR
jgi:hypothetical protein